MATADQQRRWRERKRLGLVVPRGEPTKIEEIAMLHHERNRRRTVLLLEGLGKRMRNGEDQGAVWDAIEEVKAWR